MRYAVFADRGTAGAPEDILLKDRPLQFIAAAWLVVYSLAVWNL